MNMSLHQTLADLLALPATGGALAAEQRGTLDLGDGVIVEKWLYTAEPVSYRYANTVISGADAMQCKPTGKINPTPALLGSLALFAMAKSNGPTSSRGWLPLSFMAFLVCGMGQMLNNLPSYIPEMRDGVSYYFRSFALACGVIIGFVRFNFVLRKKAGFGTRFKATLHIPLFWKFVLVKQGFGLLSAYFLIYRGMDMLSAAGIGSASYPLLVGSCVIAFTLYSLIVLKERNGRGQYVGLILCVCGIVMICI